MYLLYYAGMANDKVNEQIGLAISEDGLSFEKVNSDGLIIPRDENIAWKSLRVCNPTVLKLDSGSYIMYYQGIDAASPNNIVLGNAFSNDGINWKCDENPSVTLDDLESFNPGVINRELRNGIIEPSVITDNSIFKMWFVHLNNTGNVIYYCESKDGVRWKIKHKTNLEGMMKGEYKIHYPQIIKEGKGYRVYFTLFSKDGIYGIFTMYSDDGIDFRSFEQISFSSNISNRISLDPSGLIKKIYAKYIGNIDFYAGISHAHVLKKEDKKYLYYHSYNRDTERDLYMDIGFARLDGTQLKNPLKILRPEKYSKNAWDSYFVADPFILEIE